MRTGDLAWAGLVGAAGGLVQHAGAVELVAVEAVPLPPLPDAHGFAGCFAGVVDGWLLVAGGANFPDGVMPWDGGRKVWHDSVFALELANPDGGWKRAGALREVSGYGVCASLPQGVLMAGGGDANGHSRATRLMTFADGKLAFKELPPLPMTLANGCGALVDGKLHVVGGTERPDSVTASARHFVLDPATGWSELPPLPGAGVMLASAAAVDGVLYISGGCSLHAGADGKPVRTYLKSGWKFADGAWSGIADLPRAAVGAASPCWVVDGRFLIAGGDDGAQVGISPTEHKGFCRDLLVYDPKADRWTRRAEAKEPLPVTLPGVQIPAGLVLPNGEIRPGVRTPRVTLLKLP